MRKFLIITALLLFFTGLGAQNAGPGTQTKGLAAQNAAPGTQTTGPGTQTGEDLSYSVRGTVVDARTGDAVVAVSVSVPGEHHATVTNSDGSFIIKSASPIKELAFSHVGYYSTQARVPEARAGAHAETPTGKPITVRLTPVAYPLPEASIISGNPKEIVESAIEKIAENYPEQPELLRCFYRETLQKRQRYIGISEAVARISKAPYKWHSVAADRTALEKSRIIMSQRKRDTLSVRMMGGPTFAATFDFVKNYNILFTDIELGLYSFNMEYPSYIGDRLHFVISFKPAKTAEYPLFNGLFYIDQQTLTFSRVEMMLDMSDPAKATDMMLVRKPMGLRFTPKQLGFIISYRRQGDISRMDYCRSTMSFACDWRKHLVSTNYTAVNELVVTGMIEPAVQIPRNEMFRPADILDEKAKEFLDPDFWEAYNIIEPSESLENAVGRLKKQK